jgi:hypothetical protein
MHLDIALNIFVIVFEYQFARPSGVCKVKFSSGAGRETISFRTGASALLSQYSQVWVINPRLGMIPFSGYICIRLGRCGCSESG